jgi:hypothetical protein
VPDVHGVEAAAEDTDPHVRDSPGEAAASTSGGGRRTVVDRGGVGVYSGA